MLKESLKSKILDSAPGRYFYGHIVMTEKGVDLNILESNAIRGDCANKKITQIELFKSVDINWERCLNEALIKGSCKIKQCYINKISENELVVWVCNLENEELVQTRDELETQKSLLELFIDAIPDIVFYKDLDRNYITCNNALAKLINKPKQQIIGKKDSEVDILHFQADKCKEFDQKVIESKIGITVEEKVFLPSGEVRIMESLKVPFWGANNKLLGIIGVCRDITEKRKTEELIVQNEKIFREVFENISEGMIITQKGKILEINNAYEEIYGESISLINRIEDIQYLINKFKLEDIKDKLPIDYKEPFTLKGEVLRKDGERRFVRMKYQLISEEKGVLLIGDITSQIEKNIELERLRQEFFANLSHEFKTPINLIHSALHLLKLQLKELPIDEISYERCFDICSQNISRLLKLTSNLIDSTKIDSGYFKYNPQNYDIVQVIENTALSTVDYCQQNGLNIIFDTEVEEKIVYFDAELMERIILNLISNAIKYSKGKNIVVFIKQIEDCIRIEVKDDGIGIPKDRLEDIFEKFTQINNRFTKVGEGSGLGLYLVKSFVKMHNGKIDLHSELGNGCCFGINIPDIQDDNQMNCSSTYSKIEYVERTRFEFSDLI